jgi:ATP-dependent protease ClpP protease subunit
MIYKKIDGKTAEIRLYGNIGSWFSDGEMFTSLLDRMESDGISEAVLRMHCYGGSVFEGNVIGNALKRSKLNISIAIDGIAASMGCFILSYLPAEKVTIASNGFGMLHRPSSWVSGDADDLRNEAKLLDDIEKYFIDSLSQRTGKTKEEIRKTYFDSKDHWLNAEEMKLLKLAGKITDKVSDIESMDKEVLLSLGMENVYGKFAAKLENKFNIKIMDKELLIKTFGLNEVTVDSSDAVVMSKLQEKFNALSSEIKNLKESAKAAVSKEIESIIDKAVSERRIVSNGKEIETVKASFKKIGEDSGIEALKNVISAMQPQTTIASQIAKDDGKGSSSEEKTFEWYREHNPKALSEMETKEPEKFKELYKNEFGVYPDIKTN